MLPPPADADGLDDSVAALDTSGVLRGVVWVLCHQSAVRASSPTAKILMTIQTQGGAWLRGAAGGR
jgi:hypothetical protein